MSTQSKTTNQAALITALGVADQLLLTDANTGQVKRISPNNVFPNKNHAAITIPTGTTDWWVRIASARDCDGVILSVYNAWWLDTPHPLLLALTICHPHHGANAKAGIVPFSTSNCVDKLRIVYSATGTSYDEAFIEIHYKSPNDRQFHVNISNNYSTTLYQSYVQGSIPEGYTSKEFDLTNTN